MYGVANSVMHTREARQEWKQSFTTDKEQAQDQRSNRTGAAKSPEEVKDTDTEHFVGQVRGDPV